MASREIGVSKPTHILWYRFFLFMARLILLPFVKWHFHIKTKRDKKEKDLPCILVFNHISNYDYLCNIDMFRPYARYIISDASGNTVTPTVIRTDCIVIPATTAGQVFTITAPDGLLHVSDPETGPTAAAGAVYDLSGRPAADPSRNGLYVKHGRKVAVR